MDKTLQEYREKILSPLTLEDKDDTIIATVHVNAMEELAECIQAVSKMHRIGDITDIKVRRARRLALLEEIADVAITLTQVCRIHGIFDDDLKPHIEYKANRLAKHVESGTYL